MAVIYDAISKGGFSAQTIEIIDNYIKQIVNGKTDLNQFNQKEHTRLCCAGEAFIGAYLVCNYAQSSLTAGEDAGASKASPANWQIDELQEKLVEEWATAKGLWFANAITDIESEYGPKIA